MHSTYIRLRGVGAAYIEWTKAEGARRFFQVEREQGELLLWLGPLHVIVTTEARLAADA